MVAVKILENILESIEEIEEEFIILKDLSCHPNLPQFYGLYLKKGRTSDTDQLWLVMEVSKFHIFLDLFKNRSQILFFYSYVLVVPLSS